jgi:hypothetical protein
MNVRKKTGLGFGMKVWGDGVDTGTIAVLSDECVGKRRL